MHSYRYPTRVALTVLVLAVVSAAAAAAEVDPGLPPEATAVLTVNVRQLLHAPALRPHALPLLQQACQCRAVRRPLEALGLDPLRDLERLSVGVVESGSPQEDDAVVGVLRGHFDTARFHALAGKLAAEPGSCLTAHKAGALKCYSLSPTARHGHLGVAGGASTDSGMTLNLDSDCTFSEILHALLKGTWVALPDHHTLVVASSKQLLREACARVAAGDRGALKAPMRKLLTELDGRQTVLFAVANLPPPAAMAAPAGKVTACGAEAQEQQGPDLMVRELSGGITLAEDFKFRCTLRATSPMAARDMMKVFGDLRLRLGGLATFLAGSDKDCACLKEIPRAFLATRKGSIILIEGYVPASTLEKLGGLGQDEAQEQP
jgi:hypothetical protein